MAIEDNAATRHVAVLGINHTCSRADMRDRLLFSGEKLCAALAQCVALPAVSEAVILSTCNRVEIYAAGGDARALREELLRFLSAFHGIESEVVAPHAYFYNCEKAVEHLYNVAASLDSMVVGEYQILGQVRDAYRSACHAGATGAILNKLFHFAVEAAKRVRTDTKIGQGAVSIASVAVELARKILGRLDRRAAMIIGAGEMSKLTARHLAQAGIAKLYFVNRTCARAHEMTARFGGAALGLDEKRAVLSRCDIVISSTGASRHIITRDEIREAMAARKNHAMFLFDIAAPRDIDPRAANLPNVFLYGIDDLSDVVSKNTRKRAAEIKHAGEILAQEREKYYAWYSARKVIPTLVALRNKFESMRDSELERYASAFGKLPAQARNAVRQFAESLTNKFLHSPSKVLKQKANNDDGPAYAETIAHLFGLKDSDDEKE
jgi:glutamyl-tRNA reductase